MKRLVKIGIVASVALALAVMAVPAMAKVATVGSFAQQIAKAKGLPADDISTAVDSLSRLGVRFADVNAPLTEAQMVAISQAAGLRVTTSHPEATVTETQVGSFITTFGKNLSGSADNPVQPNRPPRTDPQPGKGKSKGFYKSPSEPI